MRIEQTILNLFEKEFGFITRCFVHRVVPVPEVENSDDPPIPPRPGVFLLLSGKKVLHVGRDSQNILDCALQALDDWQSNHEKPSLHAAKLMFIHMPVGCSGCALSLLPTVEESLSRLVVLPA
ncbi:MAG: hypothetical protein COX57_09645 [Alphaproteobacteria bacterium CG_4_10_14_0_2_um_filter_63_37]|nr:MAG: hypothetical protein AUJ55_10135 [Proteobacteria bacterium CG1_02_64_396]PJA24223.1 MAG: hypothetical protein COX57_09645 [Alphaproteobacteria bacterium CG_4_10_14_0_2_um_filter_63_37]